jgi:hypothetical protein
MKQKPSPRVSKSRLATAAGVARQSVAKYLAQTDAPKGDRTGRFDAIPAAFFIGQCHARGTESPKVVQMRERKLHLELAAMERADAKARGELIEKASIEPGIAEIQGWWMSQLQAVIEGELPPKYEGKTTIERQKVNADAVDRLLREFKERMATLARGGSKRRPGGAEA